MAETDTSYKNNWWEMAIDVLNLELHLTTEEEQELFVFLYMCMYTSYTLCTVRMRVQTDKNITKMHK